jgi:hypothetical protein
MPYYMVENDVKGLKSKDNDQCTNKKANLHSPHSSFPGYFPKHESYSSLQISKVISGGNGRFPEMRTQLYM